MPHKLYALVATRAEHRCEYCRAWERLSTLEFEVDHIVPESRGGTDDERNLALACRACNVYKGDALDASDPPSGRVVPLYNPRRDTWDDHILVDGNTFNLVGLTETGRTTLTRLRLNRVHATRARRLTIRLLLE